MTPLDANEIHIVGIGISPRTSSPVEDALRFVLQEAECLGVRTTMLVGAPLVPAMDCAGGHRIAEAILRSAGSADAIVLGYSDVRELSHEPGSELLPPRKCSLGGGRIDLNGVPVGIVCSAVRPEAAAGALRNLRSVVHELQGWPSPQGVAIDSSSVGFDPVEGCDDPRALEQLRRMAAQLVTFALAQRSQRICDLLAVV